MDENGGLGAGALSHRRGAVGPRVHFVPARADAPTVRTHRPGCARSVLLNGWNDNGNDNGGTEEVSR